MTRNPCLAGIAAFALFPGYSPTEHSDFSYRMTGQQVQIVAKPRSDGIDISDIAVASPVAGPVPIRAVRPAGTRVAAVVVFQHQLGADPSQFELEAELLARRCGIAGLLVTAPFARPEPWKRDFDWRVGNRDAEIQRQAVIELRALLDLLPGMGLNGVRVGYVGHSYGANWGGILAGVEPRYHALVLVAGVGSVTATMRPEEREWSAVVTGLGRRGFELYRASLRPYDPDLFVARARPGSLFFQFATRDEFISPRQARAFIDAAGSRHQVRWYDTDHDFRDPTSVSDRREFLARKLGVTCTSQG